MKALLDAHISANVAQPLGGRGHDVLCVVEHSELDSATDEDLLLLAREQERVVVTFDVGDFLPLVSRFTSSEGGHAGCIMVSSKSFLPNEFGSIARALIDVFEELPEPSDWHDRVVWLTRNLPKASR